MIQYFYKWFGEVFLRWWTEPKIKMQNYVDLKFYHVEKTLKNFKMPWRNYI